ncbi:MAG: undecaprenyldiphospho-muramoylpentapeptide beta-N-acetylglucosaminyltransferase [Oscillospiraceae bacterium]|nr:undecaprenyldiphospho-muramoylpentapeptide beta-N-acetylglucosaminyltransferase [Oscillospiraceae bacterium]
MNLLLTCGGTAGHINPAVAIAKLFQARRKDTNILFVGAHGGMENQLVPKEGYAIEIVHITNFRRSLSRQSIAYNLHTLRNLRQSQKEARAILEEFRPDLVVGTGGYASFPIVREAARRGVPTAIHESNAIPGLTTRVLSKVANVVMTGFETEQTGYAHPERVVVTGTPVRPEFFRYTRQEARAALGITDERPLLLSYWGSLGADVMNGYMTDFMAKACRQGAPFRHIHGAARSYDSMKTALAAQGIELSGYSGVELCRYIYDMPTVMAAADVVFCRAGASTLSELMALGKPSVLVPSPNVTANHQTKNAKVLADLGGAILLPERDCSTDRLWRLAKELLGNHETRKAMSKATLSAAPADAAEVIYQTLSALI